MEELIRSHELFSADLGEVLAKKENGSTEMSLDSRIEALEAELETLNSEILERQKAPGGGHRAGGAAAK